MFSNQGARKSVDSFPPISPNLQSRSEFPFHRQSSASSARRRGSTASSIHSIGGQLDSGAGSWSGGVHEIGQNAISTLLQPPIVRTGLVPHTTVPASSAHKPPTARDIPPVTLTNLPPVDPAEFKPYLAQVGALYEQLRRVKESDDDGSNPMLRRVSSRQDVSSPDETHLRPGGSLPRQRKASTTSLNAASPVESPSLRRRSSSGLGRRNAQGPPPLSTIPNVYFDDDFHLENPRTFDVVSERSEVVRPPPGSSEEKDTANGGAVAPRKALATNAILQEKLSWYMDTIEMHLISSISTASTTFFSALGNLRELHSEAADSVERIKILRKELDALDQEIAVNGLEMVHKQRRRENIQQLNDAVRQLKQIVESVAVCETLVDSGDLEKALDAIDSLEKLIAGEKSAPETDSVSGPRLIDLRNAVALQGANGDITSLRYRIGKAYESRLTTVLLQDMRRHIETVSRSDVLMRWGSAAMRSRGSHTREQSTVPAYMSSTEALRSELAPVVLGLHRSKHVTVAVATYREVVLREVRNLIKRPLPSSNDDDNESMISVSTVGSKRMSSQEKSSILARNLRALDFEDAEALFIEIYVSVTETLRRLGTQVKILFDVAISMDNPAESDTVAVKSPTLNNTNQGLQEDIHMAMDMANLLGQAVDTAQDKILKVLRVRSEQTSRLPLIWFLRYFTLNLYFANECEAISGRSGTALKTTVNTHIKDFIQSHGDSEKQKLAQAMESDQWTSKDFSEKDTVLLDRILESSTRDAEAWSEGSKIWTTHPQPDEKDNSQLAPDTNGTAKEKIRTAVVDSETFILPNSAILCLEGMSHFLQLISSIPSMAPDISTSLVAYLQLFNSRCTQLILGAGATRSAGLKNITTRHLALAAQALSFIATLIPHVREFVRRHAGTGPNVNNVGVAGLMGEFDKVKRLFQEHQQSIYDKLVDIMSGRASTHTRTMRQMEWDSESPVKVNTYMETLCKETSTLHKVLTKNLPEMTVHIIMGPVFQSYKAQLGVALNDIAPATETGKKRLELDINYLKDRLSKIEGFGSTGDHLLSIVESKEVAPPVARNGNGATDAKESNGVDSKEDQGKKEEKVNSNDAGEK